MFTEAGSRKSFLLLLRLMWCYFSLNLLSCSSTLIVTSPSNVIFTRIKDTIYSLPFPGVDLLRLDMSGFFTFFCLRRLFYINVLFPIFRITVTIKNKKFPVVSTPPYYILLLSFSPSGFSTFFCPRSYLFYINVIFPIFRSIVTRKKKRKCPFVSI